MSGSIEYKTKSRKMILNCLLENKDKSFTVKDINKYLEVNNVDVNISTIYRYLEKLVNENQVRKFTDENGNKATFQYIEAGKACDEHLHLKCVTCGNITHLDCHFMDEISKHISNDHDFQIECKNSIIFGKCAKCRNNLDEQKK